MDRNDGGPAFPVTLFDGQTLGDGTANGMSLRDYFAAKAMHAALMTARGASSEAQAVESAAKVAYMAADAMLAERAKERT